MSKYEYYWNLALITTIFFERYLYGIGDFIYKDTVIRFYSDS